MSKFTKLPQGMLLHSEEMQHVGSWCRMAPMNRTSLLETQNCAFPLILSSARHEIQFRHLFFLFCLWLQSFSNLLRKLFNRDVTCFIPCNVPTFAERVIPTRYVIVLCSFLIVPEASWNLLLIAASVLILDENARPVFLCLTLIQPPYRSKSTFQKESKCSAGHKWAESCVLNLACSFSSVGPLH